HRLREGPALIEHNELQRSAGKSTAVPEPGTRGCKHQTVMLAHIEVAPGANQIVPLTLGVEERIVIALGGFILFLGVVGAVVAADGHRNSPSKKSPLFFGSREGRQLWCI